MVFFDVFFVLVGALGFESTVGDFATENDGVGVVLAGVPAHVLGKAESAPANLTLMWFLL